jgi:hypothetical protein
VVAFGIVQFFKTESGFMYTSQFKINANRENAKKSTGPKTREGKMRSRGNAVTHGLTAMVVSPGEQESGLNQERTEWIDTFNPQNAVALRLVDVSYQCYRRLRRNLLNDDAAVARRADKAKKRFMDKCVKEIDRIEQEAGPNPVNVHHELSQSYIGCSRLIRRLIELEEQLHEGRWGYEQLERLYGYQGLTVDKADSDHVKWTKHCMCVNEFEARRNHPTCGVDRPAILDRVDARRRAWKGPGPFELSDEEAIEYEETLEYWTAAQVEMRATVEKVLNEGVARLPTVVASLDALIDAAYDKTVALRDQFAAEYEAQERLEMEAAMIDTGDHGRLRHRYIVDARRDLSHSIADAEEACGITISEARTPEIIEEQAQESVEEQPLETPAESVNEDVVASRNEAKSTFEDQVAYDDRADGDPSPDAPSLTPEPPDRL